MKTAADFVNLAKECSIAIDADQAVELLAGDALALDVREDSEFRMGHIPKAINISCTALEFMLPTHPAFVDRDKKLPLVIYCKTNGRSILAAAALKEMGYESLYVLMGGFDKWKKEMQTSPSASSS